MRDSVVFSNCSDGDVRLVGSTVEFEGRVEICVNGVWEQYAFQLAQAPITLVTGMRGMQELYAVSLDTKNLVSGKKL